MAWDDLVETERQLTAALQQFDWERADAICKAIVDRLSNEPDPFPEPDARRWMQKLRRKRRFAAMGLLAEAVIESGLRTAQVRRQYSQALIDQGMLSAAERELQSLIDDPQTGEGERAEAHGLLGRIYKQRYMNIGAGALAERAKRNLQRSFDEYSISYAANPREHTWHGINMVALLARAEADSVLLQGETDYRALASDILEVPADKEANAVAGPAAFDLATQMEAFVALGQFKNAGKTANVYADALDADAFEVACTTATAGSVASQQCRSTWCNAIPILRAAQLIKEGGGMSVPLKEARRISRKSSAATVPSRSVNGTPERGKSVCRVETVDGKGVGTGWLVKSSDFFDGPLRPLVLTNAHVVSTTYATAIRPPDAWVNFQLLGQRIQMKSIVWSSPVAELDATFMDLDEDLTCEPLPLFPSALEMTEPGPRLYIIGHPGGRDLEFSLHDNRLIACNQEKLHYRTPTEGGSSGSPVFDPLGWQVVGLHHAGKANMAKLGGPPGAFYEANEGLAILSIQRKTKGHG
jgi:hypothetical protein